MSYARIGGGPYTGVEVASLSGQLAPDTKGVINTPLALATVTDTLGNSLSSISDLLNDIDDMIPDSLLSDGRWNWGIMNVTNYPEPMFGPAWNDDLINSTKKRDLAKLMISILAVAGILFVGRTVAPRMIGSGLLAVPNVLSTRRRHRQVMEAVEGVGELQAPPQLPNSAKVELALAHHLKGMVNNDRGELLRGLKLLQAK